MTSQIIHKILFLNNSCKEKSILLFLIFFEIKFMKWITKLGQIDNTFLQIWICYLCKNLQTI